MADLIVACVRSTTLYQIEHVMRLRDMVAKHLKLPYTMVCLTDQRDRCPGVSFVDIAALDLQGAWGKMALFEPLWRDRAKVVYFDLNLDILNDLSPLAEVPGEFAILENPMRAIQPYKYDASVMMIGGGMCAFVWEKFDKNRDRLMTRYAYYGPRSVIEALYPAAQSLQRVLPKRFFDLTVVQRD